MMQKGVPGLHGKYAGFVPVFGIFPGALLLLPWLSKPVGEKGSISGIELLMNIKFYALLIGLPVVLLLLTSLLLLFVRRRPVMLWAAVVFAVTAIAAVLVLFTAKKLIDGRNMLQTPFLIRDLGLGYWMFLILSFAGLSIALKAVKISTGYIILCTMSIVWLFPIAWIVLTSFRGEQGFYTPYFFPRSFTLNNYVNLLTDTETFYYARWFSNTLFVAAASCILSTFIVLSTAYVLSRIRFQGRKLFMNLLLILGMFPGFMSMIAVYYIIKAMGLSQSLAALVLVYSGGSALGYYVVKGFFDTIPRALDDAACIDGATKWQVFTRITMPLSKPIIIYTILTSFISPWADFIMARVILGDNYDSYTVALGLFTMLEKTYIDTWYTRFAAGAVLVSIPISLLFICLHHYYIDGVTGSVKG